MMRAVAVAVVVLLGCAGGDDGVPPGDTFLAFSSTFASFRTWPSFHSDGPAPGTQPPDVLGPRTQYIRELPPSGSAEFPVGSVIVEARESGTMHILGAVKRGGTYNAGGAVNWEWFELTENPVTIAWRGVGPPDGETYGGDPDGGCNSCHAACGADNDYICSPYLKLSGF
jgi:hypothetical protein